MGFVRKILEIFNVITYMGTATGASFHGNGVSTANGGTAIGILAGKNDLIFGKNDIESFKLLESNKLIRVNSKTFNGNVYSVILKDGKRIELSIKEEDCKTIEKILNG